MKTTPILMILLWLQLAEPTFGESRTWSDRSGKFTSEAELVSADGARVELRKLDGKIIAVPIEKLSDKDQQYLAAIDAKARNHNDQARDDSQSKNSVISKDPKTAKDLKRLLEKQRDASLAVGILKGFIASDDIATNERAIAQAELPHWTELAGQGALRIGNKWVTPAQFQQMKEDEIRMIKEAHRLIDVGSDQTAKERFESASDVNPEGVRADFYLGLLNALLAKYPPDAEKHFRECVRRLARDEDLLAGTRRANYVAALNNLAVIEVRMHRYDDAIGTWRRALDVAPFTPELVQNLGLMTDLGTNSDVFRIPKNQRTSAANLYAKVTVQNNLARFDKKVGWLLMPYIDTLDGTIDEKGDEEYVNIAWCTGFAVAPGCVVTSRHSLADSEKIVVKEGGNIFEIPSGKVVALSDHSNLALLKLSGLNCKGLPLSTNRPHITDDVTVNGYREPSFGGDTKVVRTATVIDIPSVMRHVETIRFKTAPSIAFASFSVRDMIQHDAILPAGLEGAPLLDRQGRVVGVHLGNPPSFGTFGSKFSIAEPSSYAVNFLKPLLPDLVSDSSTGKLPEDTDTQALEKERENSIFLLSIQKRAPRLTWSHRIEELHRLQRQGAWTSYEDKTCMACNGRRTIECPNRNCMRGSIRHSEPELKHRDANTGKEVWGSRTVVQKCTVCGGTGFVTCPNCDASGNERSFR